MAYRVLGLTAAVALLGLLFPAAQPALTISSSCKPASALARQVGADFVNTPAATGGPSV